MEVQIQFPEITPLEYNGKEVFTTKQLAMLFNCTQKHLQNQFNYHKENLQYSVDYYYLKDADFKKFKAANFKKLFEVNENDVCPAPLISIFTKHAYVWAKSGALKLAKLVDTDEAEIIHTHFNIEKTALPESENKLYKVDGNSVYLGRLNFSLPKKRDFSNREKIEYLIELIRMTKDDDFREKLMKEAAKLILGKDF